MTALPRDTTLYKITGTDTYRLSSVTLLGRWGGNRQNIEKSARSRYVPDEGKSFCQVDQSGAEALIVAHMMPRSNKLRQLFDNKIKIHNYLGVVFTEQWRAEFPMVGEFAKIPIPELKSHPDWSRFVAAVAASDDNPPATRYYYHYKQTGHSANYNIFAPAFVENILLKSGGKVRLTKQQGEAYLEGYHSLIPEIRRYYHRKVAETYERTGILYSLQGFPLHITKKLFPHEYSKIYDKIPQSTVGCISNIAFTQMQNYILENKLRGWDILQNNHDSYLGQAPDGEIMDMARVMKRFMEQELTSPFGEVFNMRSEVQVGKNWSPFDPEYNPEGLKKVDL